MISAYEFAVDVAARGVLSKGTGGKLSRKKSDWVRHWGRGGGGAAEG